MIKIRIWKFVRESVYNDMSSTIACHIFSLFLQSIFQSVFFLLSIFHSDCTSLMLCGSKYILINNFQNKTYIHFILTLYILLFSLKYFFTSRVLCSTFKFEACNFNLIAFVCTYYVYVLIFVIVPSLSLYW